VTAATGTARVGAEARRVDEVFVRRAFAISAATTVDSIIATGIGRTAHAVGA
jgi:hypothetical protein